MNYSTNNTDVYVEDEIFTEINTLIESKSFLKNSLLKREDYFSNNFLSEIKLFLDKDSILYVYFLIGKYNLALDELRRNNFSSADNYFAEIESITSGDQTISNLVVTTMANNVLAYKAYKYGNNDEVFNLLINSLEIDCVLEEKGFTILHFHKIQTIHNIARTYLKNNQSAGIDISLDLIKFLSSKKENFTFEKFTFCQEKNAISPELCRELFLQILNELIFYFIKNNNESENFYFEIMRSNFSEAARKESYLDLIIDWLNIVLDFNKNPVIANINPIAGFLESHNDKLASLSVFLIKKLLSVYPCEIEQIKKIRSDMSSFGFSI